MEHKCKNCFLLNRKKMECKVAILVDGIHRNLPVFLEDSCHLEELKIQVDQVRWFEDKEDNNKLKIEYPEGFFGKESDGV
jgi:hypothetical protein